MKMLQTGDLHLGKVFYEHSLLEDQQYMLTQLHRELMAAETTGQPYDVLLIAGDVYDRSVPPPEAVALFDKFLTNLHRDIPLLHIIIIPGNHDSARRLGFCSRLLHHQNIHIYASPDQITQPLLLESGKGKTHDTTAFYAVPFLTAGALDTGTGRQPELYQEAIRQILEHHRCHSGIPAVLCAHLFVATGCAGGSERIFTGTAEQVPAEIFTPFAYTAAGHLHRAQNPGGNIWYAGSPLAYSFDEADTGKCFLQVVLDLDTAAGTTAVTVKKIPVTPLHPVTVLTGSFEDFYRDSHNRYGDYRNCYLEIRCTDSSLIENPMAQLKSRYPLLLSFRQENAVQTAASETVAVRRQLLDTGSDTGVLQTEKLFEAFMRDMYQELPEQYEAEKDLFLNTARKIQEQNL